MIRSSLLTRRRRKPEINIVPLIDISVKLIFFFLVSMQFREASTLNLNLPTSETAGQTRADSAIVISVATDGAFEFRGRRVDKAGLESELAALGDPAKAGTVLIRSDQRTPVQAVVDAMDACRKRGFNTLRFQTQ
jgi:biopolymer transport protein ExbD